MPRDNSIQSVLVIGSGPIVIGQACEFDYSGTQACRVLRAEGIRVILVNSNPATIMTDPEFADATYIEPITGIAAYPPMFPRPSTAEPSVMIAIVFAFMVYLYARFRSFAISRHTSATPGVYARERSCLFFKGTFDRISSFPLCAACRASDSS